MPDVARDKSSAAYRFVDSQQPSLVEQWGDRGPPAAGEQQVVAFRDHERGGRGDPDRTRDGFFDLAHEAWHEHIVFAPPNPSERVDEAVDVERLRRSLAVRRSLPEELLVGEVEAVHWQ